MAGKNRYRHPICVPKSFLLAVDSVGTAYAASRQDYTFAEDLLWVARIPVYQHRHDCDGIIQFVIKTFKIEGNALLVVDMQVQTAGKRPSYKKVRAYKTVFRTMVPLCELEAHVKYALDKLICRFMLDREVALLFA